MKIIEVKWEGPFDFEQIRALQGSLDYGVYQVYGNHRIYGKDVLLYIGQANHNPFGIRMPQHDGWWDWSENNIAMYVGRIENSKALENKEWERQIDFIEAVLIKYCQPSWNSSGLNSTSRVEEKNILIKNIGERRCLPKEVSSD